ncbi:hypothetical protein CAEBREN_10618 [Caenorhabditis brenneri]|uniref:Uncharacterized protein n=1 Tax=Caenorhabditis brenneri TaxID=135651 RepID=G0NXL1_CAEBE|nr:hypothetical protein CAEBREN_10618 [Caenorhabditis brenneri]
MSGIKDHQHPNATVNSIGNLLMPSFLRTHIQELTVKCDRADTQIRELEGKLKEFEELRNKEKINLKVYDALMVTDDERIRLLSDQLDESSKLNAKYYNEFLALRDTNSALAEKLELSEAKSRNLELQLQESETKNVEIQAQLNEINSFRMQAVEAWETLNFELEDFKTQSQARLNEMDALRIKAMEEWQACKIEFDNYKNQAKGARIEAHRALVAQQTRCTDSEAQVQHLQQLLAVERASWNELDNNFNTMEARFQSQEKDLVAKWQARYNKDILDLKTKFTEAKGHQEAQFTEIKSFLKAKLEEAKKQLKVKDEEMEQLKKEHRENAELVMDLENKNLQVEIQLQKSQEEVCELRKEALGQMQTQLDKSRENVTYLEGLVFDSKKKLVEQEAHAAQALKKRGRDSMDQTAAEDTKKRRAN